MQDLEPQEHGGDLDRAIARHGGLPGDWIDLSTGINPTPYPLPPIPERAWNGLPTATHLRALEDAARAAYRTEAETVAVAGAQAAIQTVPRLLPSGCARILGPTYSEHAIALEAAGWTVDIRGDLQDLAGADIAVVVNPNNPDGQWQSASSLTALSETVGLLIVDESFCDPTPNRSIVPMVTQGTDRLVVLRSFGKFYGLAGLRLGFAATGSALASMFRAIGGPWPVSGPAIEVGRIALADTDWRRATCLRLDGSAARLDALAFVAGWSLVGGTSLFRTYDTGDAAAVQDRLASHRIWTRRFSYAPAWLRLGLPARESDWRRLAFALGCDRETATRA
ncbi:MAG: threonine-phosphate decarboxylase CobD [Alphaproteobacteria bacterium]|nr:threonine-phosphate decarboxylase CobD [Alphaproteobacteria bacterium]